jgi:hypothetical protein
MLPVFLDYPFLIANSVFSNVYLGTVLIFKKSLKIPKGNQNPYIEEEQTIQWQKKSTKGQVPAIIV